MLRTRFKVLSVMSVHLALHCAGSCTASHVQFSRGTDTIQVAGDSVLGSQATFEYRFMLHGGDSEGQVFTEWRYGLEDKGGAVGPSHVGAHFFPLGNVQPIVAYTEVTTDVWHHFAYIYDGSEERLYLDGVRVSSRSMTGGISNAPNSVAAVGAIARNGVVQSFVGLLDTLRLSSVARYSGDVFTPPPGDLATDGYTNLLYNFNEAPGSTTVHDLSGNGRDGTLGTGFTGATSPQLVSESSATFQLIVAGAPPGTVSAPNWKDIYRFSIAGTGGPATQLSSIPNGQVSDPCGVGFRSPRELHIANREGSGPGYVSRFLLDESGINWSSLEPITQPGIQRASGVGFNYVSGEEFVASVTGGVFRFVYEAGTPAFNGVFGSGLSHDVYVVPTGEKLFVIGGTGQIRQYSIAADGGLTQLQSVSVPGATYLTYFGVRPDGEIYVADPHQSKVYRFKFDENWNLSAGGSIGIYAADGVAFSHDGQEMFVGRHTSTGAGVYRFAYQPATDSWEQTGFISTPAAADIGIFLPYSEAPTVTITSPTSTPTCATSKARSDPPQASSATLMSSHTRRLISGRANARKFLL